MLVPNPGAIQKNPDNQLRNVNLRQECQSDINIGGFHLITTSSDGMDIIENVTKSAFMDPPPNARNEYSYIPTLVNESPFGGTLLHPEFHMYNDREYQQLGTSNVAQFGPVTLRHNFPITTIE